MSHNLEIVNGKASFVAARKPGWHNLGELVSELMHWEDACFKVMPWQIIKSNIENEMTGEPSDFFGLYRSDNGEMLHVVKAGYEVVQPFELFAFIDAAIGENGFHYETAGVLGKGEKIFTMANVAEFDVMATGDKHQTYLLGTNSYDGSLAETYKLTDTRVVCQNTLNFALQENGKELKFRHTKNMRERKMDAMQFLSASLETTASVAEKMEVLAQRMISPELFERVVCQYLDIFAPKDLTDKKAAEVLQINALFEENDRDAFPEFRGTAYNALNSLTEFEDHFKAAETEKQRAYNSIFGKGDARKQEGIDLILELTANAPLTNQSRVYSYTDTTGQAAQVIELERTGEPYAYTGDPANLLDDILSNN